MIPAQEVKDAYSYDEVQHLIAREWAKQEIITLRNGQLELQKQIVELTGGFTSEMRSMREMLAGLPGLVASQISECRKDMRQEIENDFPSKLETLRMEQRIEDKISGTDATLGKQISALDKKVDSLENKVDRQWLKITVVVSTIVSIGGVVQWLITTRMIG